VAGWAAVALLALVSAALLSRVDERSWSLIRNTLLLAGATCAVSMPVGTTLAWLLARTDLPGRKLGLTLLGILLFVPLYLQAAAWQPLLTSRVCYLLLGSDPDLQAWAAAIWVHAMAALPWVTLIVGAGFWLVEPELEEQALLDATPGRVFLRVTARCALGAIAVAALWTAIVAAGEMTVTDLFALRTYAEEVYTTFPLWQNRVEPLPAAMPGAVLTAWIVVGGLVLVARLVPRRRPITTRPRRQFRLGAGRTAAVVAVGLLMLLLVGVPLGSLCYKAGGQVVLSDAGTVQTWSPAKCAVIVATSPWRYRREFGWSLALGALAATAAVLAGAVLAWFARRGRLRMAAMLSVCAVGLSLPGPIVGLALIRLLDRPGCRLLGYLYDQSILAPWLALAIRGVAPATLILWHALRTVPQELLDAAAVDGAGRWRRFWGIALRSRLPAVGLAWLVVLALSLGDLAATILVVPPGLRTLSVLIFDLMHSGVEDRVAGICLAMVLISAAVAAAAARLARKWGLGA